ncbi:hypothetical protein KKD19_05945 [Patescibacteria group bacterium]|nr:hypothetical protein [Patescibacteria group bacterium]MBU4512746.1 hypothetical protein [Patescibacteria group bacterium]MCG2693086.1 hypothetical protein [Candidatus Parcubacteria bacterium]
MPVPLLIITFNSPEGFSGLEADVEGGLEEPDGAPPPLAGSVSSVSVKELQPGSAG